MKKIIIILFILAALFFFTGCGLLDFIMNIFNDNPGGEGLYIEVTYSDGNHVNNNSSVPLNTILSIKVQHPPDISNIELTINDNQYPPNCTFTAENPGEYNLRATGIKPNGEMVETFFHFFAEETVNDEDPTTESIIGFDASYEKDGISNPLYDQDSIPPNSWVSINITWDPKIGDVEFWEYYNGTEVNHFIIHNSETYSIGYEVFANSTYATKVSGIKEDGTNFTKTFTFHVN